MWRAYHAWTWMRSNYGRFYNVEQIFNAKNLMQNRYLCGVNLQTVWIGITSLCSPAVWPQIWMIALYATDPKPYFISNIASKISLNFAWWYHRTLFFNMMLFKTWAKKRKVSTTFLRLSRRCYTDVNIHLYYSCVEILIKYLTAVSVNAEYRNFF